MHSHIIARLGLLFIGAAPGGAPEENKELPPMPHLHSNLSGILKQSSYCQECLLPITELQHSVLKGLIEH